MKQSNHYAQWNETELILCNGIVTRSLRLPSATGPICTTEYRPVFREFPMLQGGDEFRFTLNGRPYCGADLWRLMRIEEIRDEKEGQGAKVVLRDPEDTVELELHYLLYPNSSVIRKHMVLRNLTAADLNLEDVDTERFIVPSFEVPTYSWVYSDYGRRKSIGPFQGGMQDAIVMVHHPAWRMGVVIGNEVSGVMKHTSVFWRGPEIVSGLSHKEADYPFRKWLAPGELFQMPQVFTVVYCETENPMDILHSQVQHYIRRHMGIRLSEINQKPIFAYNTWAPFGKDICESLVLDLADAAAEAGVTEFIIDDGWQDSYGDCGVNEERFPNGLRYVTDHIRALGMKPGLWMSIGTASPDSRVYQEHPEWFVEDRNGNHTSLVIEEGDKFTACFNTGWRSYIADILDRLIIDYGLEYLKLDFSVVTSPYRFDPTQSGCYADHHPGHRDHPESLFINYEPMWEVFDALHAKYPHVFIDCTFETMGGLQLIDYAMLKHAEGNWLANFYSLETGESDLRIRQMAWWRGSAMPASSLVIGNASIDSPGHMEDLRSLAGAMTIVCGDPRKLDRQERDRIKALSRWLQEMESIHSYMDFRQDLPGFGEPQESMWDGFQRINTETGTGGIVGVFRQGSHEDSRMVKINYLQKEKEYHVAGEDGAVLCRKTGAVLMEKGFAVVLPELYDARLFEVRIVEASSL